MTPVRAAFRGVLVANMGYDAAEADAAILQGKLDAVAFGASFLANPDLPARLEGRRAPSTRPILRHSTRRAPRATPIIRP